LHRGDLVAGILDKKTRIMDAVVTESGRRQMSAGRLRIEYASLTDGEAFYEAGEGSAADDATQRIYFECQGTRRQDFITFETDDSGNLVSFTGGDYEVGSDGTLYQGTDNRRLDPVSSGSVFSSLVDTVLSSSIDNFKNLQTIGTKTIFDDHAFQTDVDFIDFYISENSPMIGGADDVDASISIDIIEPLFLDYRTSHIDNFQFLPPIITSDRSSTGAEESFGEYTDLNQLVYQGTEATWMTAYGSRSTYSTLYGYQYSDIEFTKNSKDANIMFQVFESGGTVDSRLKKLDVIDAGVYVTDEGLSYQTFFVGKVFIDSVGQPTFVNIFQITLAE